MIPVRGYKGCRIGVLGLGRSGLATAYALRAGGAMPVLWDDNEYARRSAQDAGFEIVDLYKDASWEDIVCLVISPGIPHLYPSPHPIIAKAWEKGVSIDNDIGLFFRSYVTSDWDMFDTAPKVVCITGSNGKSTTTALVTHILNSAGQNAAMGGNIGRGVLDLDPAHDGAVLVLELSSFQIELARVLAPDIAVFLNFSEDHLERHGGVGGYFAAKARLFHQGGANRAVIGIDQMEGRFLANQCQQSMETNNFVIRVSSAQKLIGDGWSVFVRKGFLSEWKKSRQIGAIDLRDLDNLKGVHNHENACTAYAVCRSLGLSPKKIQAGLTSFVGLPHRSQLIAQHKGVRFINDSKATNADAAEKSLLAYKNIHWIVGGRPKTGGISKLNNSFGNVKCAYIIGEAVQEFPDQLREVAFELCNDLQSAFTKAVETAEDGDSVLLAPACASYDQFESFEARGDAFQTLVEHYIKTE